MRKRDADIMASHSVTGGRPPVRPPTLPMEEQGKYFGQFPAPSSTREERDGVKHVMTVMSERKR